MGAAQQIAEAGAPGFSTVQVSVGTTLGGTLLTNPANKNRRRTLLVNIGGAATYIGPQGVTVGNGQLLVGTVGHPLEIFSNQPLYGIVASSTNEVGVSEEYD